MGADDWILTFGLDLINPVSVLIQRVLNKFIESEEDYEISNIINAIEKEIKSLV